MPYFFLLINQFKFRKYSDTSRGVTMRLSENNTNNTCETLITQLYTTTLKVNSYFLALFNGIIFLFFRRYYQQAVDKC